MAEKFVTDTIYLLSVELIITYYQPLADRDVSILVLCLSAVLQPHTAEEMYYKAVLLPLNCVRLLHFHIVVSAMT